MVALYPKVFQNGVELGTAHSEGKFQQVIPRGAPSAGENLVSEGLVLRDMGRRRKKRVEEPLTEDMLAELLDAPDPRAFIKRREVGERSLAEYLDALKLLLSLLQCIAMADGEDDNGISPILAIQLVGASRLGIEDGAPRDDRGGVLCGGQRGGARTVRSQAHRG